MRPRLKVAGCCTFLIALCWLEALQISRLAAQETVIRVDVDLVRVLVTVKNMAGELISALSVDDFEVKDNGVPQKIAVFER